MKNSSHRRALFVAAAMAIGPALGILGILAMLPLSRTPRPPHSH